MDDLLELQNKIQQKIADHLAENEKAKARLLKQALVFHDVDFNEEIERKRLFKTIHAKSYEISKTPIYTKTDYFYNDGSIEGLKILEIEEKQNEGFAILLTHNFIYP